MCAPSPPAPPDPAQTIAAQSRANIDSANQTAELNRVNQYTPYGNLVYSQSGNYPDGSARYSANVSLSPEEQQIFNNSTRGQINLGGIALGMQNQVGNSYTSPISTSGLPGIASGVTNNGPALTGTVAGQQDMAGAIKNAQDAAYKTQTQYLDPQFKQGQAALDNNLINQGITQGSDAYNNAQLNFHNQQQQAYGNAQMQAVQAGQQEQNVLFGQDLSKANFQNQANQQAFGQGLSSANLQNSANTQGLQQLFALRNQPLNEYNSLMTGAQVQNPTFTNVPTANVANTDVGGITNQGYQNQMSAYNASQAGLNNLFSLGGSLGAAAIMSDRRMKRDVERAGTTPGGYPIYAFRYRNGDPTIHYGVMADEILPTIPDAVLMDEDGYFRVDYRKVP